MALRHQVVEEFARKRLKCLASDPFIERISRELEEEIKKFVGEEVWESGKGFSVKITERVHELIRKATEDSIRKIAVEAFDGIIESYREVAEQRISRYELKLLHAANEKFHAVIEAMEKGLGKRMDAAFEKRVSEEINKRLEMAASLSKSS